MRYLFFDVECSNYFNEIGKICEIGYIITDENLNIIPNQKVDIIINPGKDGRFFLKGRRRRADLHLFHEANDYEAYKNSPNYEFFYDNIKFLFTQKDLRIFGFAVDGDMRCISQNNKRYSLPDFSFDGIDVQKFLALYKDGKIRNQRGLEATFIEMCPKYVGKVIPHKPDDDALMTMLILKKMCSDLCMTVEEMVLAYPECITTHESLLIESISEKRRKGIREKNQNDSFIINKEAEKMWDDFYEESASLFKDFDYPITISYWCKSDVSIMEKVIAAIKDKNLLPTNSLKEAKYIIVKNDNDFNRIKNSINEPLNLVGICIDDFLNKIAT